MRLPLVIAFALVSATAMAADCDRACLKTTLDQYLNALAKHDPGAAPLFIAFRQTENGRVVKLGDGIWKDAGAPGDVQRRYYDPVSGNAAFFGTMKQGERTAVVNVRIRVEDRKITEAEWYIAHQNDLGMNGQQGGNLWNPTNLAAHQPPERVVPRNQRVAREALIAITNSYFDGIVAHDGSVILSHPDCLRLENGGNPPPNPQGPTICNANLSNINIHAVVARRYDLVDEEAQAVLAHAVFLRRPGMPQRRNAFAEWFFIDAGRIRSVYSAMFYPEPDQVVPNWPPYDSNWPINPGAAAPAPPKPAPPK